MFCRSPPNSAFPIRKISTHPQLNGQSTTQRRSSQSKRRAAKLRKLYSREYQHEDDVSNWW